MRYSPQAVIDYYYQAGGFFNSRPTLSRLLLSAVDRALSPAPGFNGMPEPFIANYDILIARLYRMQKKAPFMSS